MDFSGTCVTTDYPPPPAPPPAPASPAPPATPPPPPASQLLCLNINIPVTIGSAGIQLPRA